MVMMQSTESNIALNQGLGNTCRIQVLCMRNNRPRKFVSRGFLELSLAKEKRSEFTISRKGGSALNTAPTRPVPVFTLFWRAV